MEISPEEAEQEKVGQVLGSGEEVNVPKEPKQRYDVKKGHKVGDEGVEISNSKEVE